MKHIFYLTILLLIYDNNCFITNYKNKEFIYKFKNTIIASNKASDKVLSQWTYSGNLIIQEYDDCKIFKLDNIKTSIFNGVRMNLDVNESIIHDDKKILMEPFGVYYKNLLDVNISVTPNDELWSINMKKSIASSFMIDTSIKSDKTDIEQLIFGKCNINLEVKKSGVTKLIEKTINHTTCIEGPTKQSTNVKWYKNNPFQQETKRIYVVSKNNCLFSIDSSSNFTLQTSPDMKSPNRIEQNQYFELITTKENTKPFKIHQNTIIQNLVYNQIESKKQTQKDYLENFVLAYTNFKTQMKQHPLDFSKIPAKTPISLMLSNLKHFDENCLRKLLVGILMGKDADYYEIFLEILPYAGTKHTTNLIKQIIKDEVKLEQKLKLLGIFPEYINEVTEETLQNFEEFFFYDYDDIHVKQSAVLSFASLVAKGIELNTIDDQIAEIYVKRFYQEFLNAQNYDAKMTYLLGLVNVSKKLPLNAILNIIYNQKESRHLRELAMYGFKNSLKPFGKELYNKFWTIVKNSNESFETRIAALDLILSFEISEEQFNEIVNYYDRELNNPYDEHIANYLTTTIISLQNNTGYQHYLGDWATKIYQSRKLRQNLQTWSTGNYRFSFTDENSNFGLAMQTKLIADPITSSVNVIQFSFNQFAMSMDFGELTVYLKLEGVVDLMFIKTFLAEITDDTPTNIELIKLIQQCKYQFFKQHDDLFIDLVVFSDNRAVFAMHTDQFNLNRTPILEGLLKHIQSHKSVSFIMNKIKIPSDLGTEIKIKYDMQKVIYHEFNNLMDLIQNMRYANVTQNNKILTQKTETINSINPLLNAEINVEKLHHDFKTFKIPLFVDKTLSISWSGKNDYLNWVMQNEIYTFVDNITILKQNCINCNEIEVIPNAEIKAECVDSEKYYNQCHMDKSVMRERLIPINPLGVSINITSGKDSEEMEILERMRKYGINQPSEIINSHKGNALTFPPFKPILYYIHLILHNRYLENDLKKFSLRTTKIYDDAYTTKLKISFNDDLFENIDSINGFDDNIIFEITNMRNSDAHILSGAKLTLKLENLPKFKNQKLISTETNFAVIADILQNDEQKKKFCLNYTSIYPNILGDKLSLDPVKQAESETLISWDDVWTFEKGCTPYFLKFTEVFSVNNEHNKIIANTDEYKTCKNESIGLKYTPSTQSCTIAHKAASLYRDYEVYMQTQHQGMHPGISSKNKIYEYHHIDDKTIDVTVSRQFLSHLEIQPKPEFLNYKQSSTWVDLLSENPMEFSTLTENTCDISSGGVKTFFNKYTPISRSQILPFVECKNNSQTALIVDKVDKIKLVFKYWLNKTVISSNITENEMKIYVNDTWMQENMKTEEFSIFFIQKDVVFIQNDLVEIYYTPWGLSIKIVPFFYKHLCGDCLQ